MNEEQNGSLSLDEVTKRFADSEQALGQAREKLESLVALEQSQSAATQGLREASAATKELVAAARQLILEAEETQQTAREVLKAGAGLLDGTDLKELQDGVGWTATAVKEGFARIEQLLGDVQQRDQRIAELEAQLAQRDAVLSGRQRKKLGLE
jgi:DNA repair exonuclease SbcCD ATPase subunit